MITIYGDASNITLTAQKRHLRVAYGQTQATPYAGYLDPSLRNTDGTFRLPISTDKLPLERSATAFSYNNGLIPGTVLVKTSGENFTVHNGAEAVKAYGLLGQFVGGTIDGVKSTNEISAWLGPDSVYDLLAPAWNDTGVASAISAATPGKPVYLYAGNNGLLTVASAVATQSGKNATEVGEKWLPVAEVVERPSAAVLRIKLLV